MRPDASPTSILRDLQGQPFPFLWKDLDRWAIRIIEGVSGDISSARGTSVAVELPLAKTQTMPKLQHLYLIKFQQNQGSAPVSKISFGFYPWRWKYIG
jgi:hypothetical protein